MTLIPLVLAFQVAAQPRQPVLSFPDRRLDDPAAYQGYETKFYRDAAGNTVQIYKEGRSGRVVHLLANADNESIGFSIRSNAGPVPISWRAPTAQVAAASGFRRLTHELEVASTHVHLGWFLLGSMRVERDFQYWKKHEAPFASEPFVLEEYARLFAAIDRLPPATRRRHLAALNARTVDDLRRRIHPRVTVRPGTSTWTARAIQLSLDGRDSLSLELQVNPRLVDAALVGDSVSLRLRSPGATSHPSLGIRVTVGSSARALTPLTRTEIFTPEFLRFLAAARDTAPLLERQARGVELLASREKLMAGLPAYATYFGRDMLVSALMMRPIWRDEVAEFSIASVLRKLSPEGQVSHEEAMGGQATREAASEYAALVERAVGDGGLRPNGDSLLARGLRVLQQNRRTRENYHMVDDEFQFPILVASWLSDTDVPASRKRAFLRNTTDLGVPRLDRLLRELALVARMTEAYAADQTATNLVSFAPRDSGRWASSSWRDSGVGYANGRFAMDVNVIYAPHALEAMATILSTLPSLGLSLDSLARVIPELGPTTPLGRYARDAAALRRATDAWWGAARHFVVRLSPDAVRSGVAARVAALPAGEREYWTALLSRTGADRDSLTFLALALDATGTPIGVASTDVATRLFLGDRPGAALDKEAVLRDVRLFTRHFPVGLHIEGVGPVVANDAYATPAVWAAFERDRYHGPRVIWGREVNLFLLGAAASASRAGSDTTFRDEILRAIDQVRGAADASGFQSELWSYELRDGRIVPVRYGTGSDVQLWSTTDLAVAFALSRVR
jgi:hypothetical protein